MYEMQLFALMNAGGSTSMQKVEMTDEGQLKVDSEISATITVESSGDELNADTLRVHQVGNAGTSVNLFQVGGVAVAQGDERAAGHLRVFHVGDSGLSAKTQLVARQTNQTAASDAADTFASADDLGRALTRVQARDLIATAYATVTNITETTLLAAAASTFHDLLWIKLSNQSGAAVNVALRSSTGGTIVDTFSIPANSTVGYNVASTPLKANESASSWTFQNTASDDSTTTIVVSAEFSKEI